jgi:SAM-dependent methyltransferase
MFGIDPSGPMSRMASRRIREWVKTSSHYYSGKSPNLSRAYAQHLPFRKRIFDTVISTFPSEYIFDPLTIQEIRRILRPGGRWVIVISAWPTGKNFVSRMLAWVFRITGLMNIQSNLIQAQIRDRFPGATSFHEVPVGDSIVFVIVNKELA